MEQGGAKLCREGRQGRVADTSREWRASIRGMGKPAKQRAKESKPTFHEAAWTANLELIRTYLAEGADPNGLDAQGFTALQRAAMAGNGPRPAQQTIEAMRLLVEAGAQLESCGREELRRTPLYLAAEFSWTVEPVAWLIEAGAKPDVRSAGGIHVVVNAMMPEVQALLSRLTRQPIPEPEPELPQFKLNAAAWRAVHAELRVLFAKLEQQGLVVLEDAGTTQDDGFDDCSQVFRDKGGPKAGLHGFCFYSRQDLNRAKRCGQLALSFWGSPKGAEADMERVGRLIVETFRKAGFTVVWNGSGAERPTVCLRKQRTERW